MYRQGRWKVGREVGVFRLCWEVCFDLGLGRKVVLGHMDACCVSFSYKQKKRNCEFFITWLKINKGCQS